MSIARKNKKRVIEDEDDELDLVATQPSKRKNSEVEKRPNGESKKRKLLKSEQKSSNEEEESEEEELQNKNRTSGKEEVSMTPKENGKSPTPSKGKQSVARNSEEDDDEPMDAMSKVQTLDSNGNRIGTIIRVKMHDFLTYDDAEFFPGPNLNVVVGPNGTGKSTIVCALAVGLAGSTTLLGRAKEISDYVKHGKENAFVEIELRGKKGNVTIKRSISKRDNKSDWRINGKQVHKKEVADMVKKLNVQVDNLCQFLPQDKVVNFAMLSHQELLRETEKAVGSEKMVELHDKLIELRKKEKEIDLVTRDHGRHLDDLKQQQKSVERDVMRFQERQKFLKRVEDLNKKKPWLEFEEQRRKAVEAQKGAEEVKGELQAYEKEKREPIVNQIKSLEDQVTEVEKRRLSLQQQLKQIDTERKSQYNNLETFESEQEKLRDELKSLHDRAQDRKKQAAVVKKDLEALQKELEDLPDQENLTSKVEELNRVLREKSREHHAIQSKLMEVQDKAKDAKTQVNKLHAKLKEFEDIKQTRLQNLQTIAPDSYKAYQWLASNQNRFEKKVLGPILLEINSNNPLHTKYLESQISSSLGAFVLQTKRDMELFNSEVFDKMKLQVQSICVASEMPYEHPVPIEQLRPNGITDYLDDVFQAHEVVKNALRANFAIHTIGCGSPEAEKHVTFLTDKTKLAAFFTPTHFIVKTASSYNKGEFITQVRPIKQPRFLAGVDLKARAEIEQEIRKSQQLAQAAEAEIPQHQAAEKNSNEEQKNLKIQRDQLVQYQRKKTEIQKKITSKETILKGLEQEEDTAAEEDKLEKKIRNFTVKRAKGATMMMDIVRKLVDTQLKYDIVNIEKIDVNSKLQDLKAKSSQYDHEYLELKRKAEQAAKKFSEEKERARNLKDTAERVAPLDDELKELFKTLPATIEELNEEIHIAKTKAEANYSANSGIIEQYEKRKREIEELEAKLGGETNSLNKLQEDIERTKNKWLPPLERLIGEINTNFSKFFKKIGCEGEVVLDKGNGEMDFEKYSIQIKVKFRTTDQLQPLDAHMQSGGERSVATMLYLISLQELTPCPFRLVDEINQGMDPHNERMIFEVVAECACKDGVPQYFLVTPKLLSDLPFREKMNILFIFNGPWQVPQKEWNWKKMLEN